MMEKIYTKLNDDGFAISDGYVKCYTTWTTGEYAGESDEYCAEGQGLPSMAYLDSPPSEKMGFARVRKSSDRPWEYVQDLRGEKSYRKTDGMMFTVDYIGELRSDFTLSAPSTPHDVWNGEGWVTDDSVRIEQNKQRKTSLIAGCNDHINSNQWPSKLALGRLSDAEKATFNKWLDYLDALNAVDPANPVWPSAPSA